MQRYRSLLRGVQWVVLGISLVYIALLLRSQWQELRSYRWQVDGTWLLISGLCLLASWLLEVGIWRAGLGLIQQRLPFRSALRIWFASMLVRYIPGNIWQPLGMTVLARNEGIRPAATVMSIALYQAVNLLAVVPLAALYITIDSGGTQRLPALFLALLPITLLLLRPSWLGQGVNWGLGRLKRETLPVRIDRQSIVRLYGSAVVDWSLWGAGLAALAYALQPFDGFDRALGILAAYPIAYAAGYLSFLTPGGLAVREGVLALLLTPFLGSMAPVVAIGMRIWQVVLELAVAALVAMGTAGGARSSSPHPKVQREEAESNR